MPTSRAANRARIEADLLTAARAELAEGGAAALSLRAVARRLDVVPSALYRYVDGRDALLTLLVTDAYRRLGATVEAADAAAPQQSPAARWTAVGRAVRGWALAHPSDWGLLYGTPVTGYQAPQDTIEPGTATVRVLSRIVADAHAGKKRPRLPVTPTLTPALEGWVDRIASGLPDLAATANRDLVALAVLGFVQILGGVSVELFGQYGADATPAPDVFDHGLAVSAALLGLTD